MIYYRYRTIELHYHNDVVEYYEWRRVLFMKNIAKKIDGIYESIAETGANGKHGG